jgi:cytochrome c oxidase assembly protein subunit 15
LKTLTGISLILVLILVSLSAYLRLVHSGIGCNDWPECYGRIGQEQTTPLESGSPSSTAAADAYRKLVDESSQPLAWATPLHRLVASVLGLLVVFLNLLAMREKRHRLISLALLSLTVFLAVLGIRSGSLHSPAVVMGNLCGGFTMLALLAWLWFSYSGSRHQQNQASFPKSLLVLALVLLCSQIMMGGLTSANFAATSCRTLPDCHGSWFPDSTIFRAMDLSRTHAVTPSGQAIGGPERMAIHQAHRVGAVLTGILILLTSILAIGKGGPWRTPGLFIGVLVLLEFLVGTASILTDLPIILAVAHNWLAGLLLLGLIGLLRMTVNPAKSP